MSWMNTLSTDITIFENKLVLSIINLSMSIFIE